MKLMRFAFGLHSLEAHAFCSLTEVRDALLRCNAGHVLLGAASEHQREFFAAFVDLDFAGARRFGIGICSEGHGLLPQVLLDPSSVFVGYNREVARIEVDPQPRVTIVELDSLFRSFIEIRGYDTIFAFHEIGLVAMARTGQVLWSFAKDVIMDCEFDDKTLGLAFMDEPPVRLDLVTGLPVR